MNHQVHGEMSQPRLALCRHEARADPGDRVVVRLAPRGLSTWDPCPLLTRTLHRALRALGRTSDERPRVSFLLTPLLPRWYRRSLGLQSRAALGSGDTDHPDRSCAEAALREAANLVCSIIEGAGLRLTITCPRRRLSRADRGFLRLLEERASQSARIEVHREEHAAQPAATAPAPLDRERRARLLAAIFGGVDKALMAGLHHDASSRLRLAVALLRRMGEAPPRELVERLALVHTALGRPERAIACQRWLSEHTSLPAEQCQALIALAVELSGPRPPAAHRAEARRCLARARLIERHLEAGAERTLLRAMWLNARALTLFRIGKRRAALSACTRACAELADADAARRFSGQLAVQCGNAGRLAVELGDSELGALWAARLGQIAEVHPPALERCSVLLGRIGRWDEAARLAGIALGQGLSLPRLQLHRAICRFHLADTAGALADLEVVERSWAGDVRLPLLRAAVLEQTGDLGSARGEYQRALRMEPRRVSAWVDLARISWLQADRTTALQALERAIELDPDRAELHARLTQIQGEANL